MACYFQIQNLAIDTSSWTAVVTPIACTSIDIQQTDGTNAIKVRTTASDSNTEKSIPVGSSLNLPTSAGGATPWEAGVTVCYLQAAAGVGPVVIEFLR